MYVRMEKSLFCFSFTNDYFNLFLCEVDLSPPSCCGVVCEVDLSPSSCCGVWLCLCCMVAPVVVDGSGSGEKKRLK
jgi:hypothetical protein